ncbi:MAG: hypothetical protein Q9162_001757 [Coniocarpon cinnabarinum]
MDVDMDIDIEYVEEEPIMQAPEIESTMLTATVSSNMPFYDPQDGPAAYREDNLEPQYPSLTKIHIRGLDDLNHDEITAYAYEHYPSQEHSRIEWIDDTSANLVYPTEETAAEALQSLSESSDFNISPSELRLAKPISVRPHAQLQIRQANTHDVKKRGAHDASRFYLFNPQYDPRERRRQYDGHRGRGRYQRGFKRRRSEPEPQHPVPFDVSMYDDPPVPQAEKPLPIESNRNTKRRRRFDSRDDLFADRLSKASSGRLRERSASPSRLASGDGRYGFEAIDAGYESPTRPRTSMIGNPNAGKELMSSPAANARSFLRDTSPAPRELFPNRRSPVRGDNAGKELFGNGVGTPYHRRTDAFDAADEAGFDHDGSPTFHKKSRNLEDRITGGSPPRKRSHDEQRRYEPMTTQPINPGFAIKGGAKQANARVKELFPEKVGDNSGKELFAGRRTARQRAEDLFG